MALHGASRSQPGGSRASSITVVIPCRDGESYLTVALSSLIEQTRIPDEIVFVDDGSTDGSLQIARDFAAFYAGRLSVTLISDRFDNASRARNAGAMLATGDRLLFLDADDVLGSETLAALEEALAGRDRGVVACPWVRLESTKGDWVVRSPSCRTRGIGADALTGWLRGWYHPTSSVMWTRRAFDEAGRWDESCQSNQDGDLMMRALVRGIPLRLTNSGTCYYRRKPSEVPSVSGERFSKPALTSRLRVLEKVWCGLLLRGRAEAYAAALAEAATEIAADARPVEPELARRARRLARRAGGIRGMIITFSSYRGVGRLRRFLRRLPPRRPHVAANNPRGPGGPIVGIDPPGLDRTWPSTVAGECFRTDPSETTVIRSPVPQLSVVVGDFDEMQIEVVIRKRGAPPGTEYVVAPLGAPPFDQPSTQRLLIAGYDIKLLRTDPSGSAAEAWKAAFDAVNGRLVAIGVPGYSAARPVARAIGAFGIHSDIGIITGLPGFDHTLEACTGWLMRREVLATIGCPPAGGRWREVDGYLHHVRGFFEVVPWAGLISHDL